MYPSQYVKPIFGWTAIYHSPVGFALVDCSIMWFLSRELNKFEGQGNQTVWQKLWNHKGNTPSVFRHIPYSKWLVWAEEWKSFSGMHTHSYGCDNLCTLHIRSLYHYDANDGFLPDLKTWIGRWLGHSLQHLKPSIPICMTQSPPSRAEHWWYRNSL